MIYYFKINKKEYQTIDSNELNFYQYLNILDILENNKSSYESLINVSKNLLYEITNIPPSIIDKLNDLSLFVIDWNKYINDLTKLNKIKKQYGNYNLKDLSNITFGNYIDIDYFLIQKTNDKIINVVALLLLPSNYNKNDLDKSINFVKTLPLKDTISILNYFTSFRLNIIKEYKYLFEYDDNQDEIIDPDEDTNDEDTDEKVYSNWIETAYMLTNKDITKTDLILNKPLIEVLNYLTWMKKQYEEEKRQLQKNQ